MKEDKEEETIGPTSNKEEDTVNSREGVTLRGDIEGMMRRKRNTLKTTDREADIKEEAASMLEDIKGTERVSPEWRRKEEDTRSTHDMMSMATD